MQKNFEEFKQTLNEDLFTWSYFVDFEKVRTNSFKLKTQLKILESLVGERNIEEKFLELINKYPEVRPTLLILIATREKKIKDLKILNTLSLESKGRWDLFDSTKEMNSEMEQEILHFFRASSLKKVFLNKDISNLNDYVFGVEVGMDTNTRKNRSGDLMENLVDEMLKKFTQENAEFKYLPQATVKKIEKIFDYKVKTNVSDRSYDFALLDTRDKSLYLIEVNLYGSGGTKLKAVAGEFEKLNNFIFEQEIKFVWLTDGPGWKTAENPMLEAFNNNEYTFNIYQFKKFLQSIS